MKLTFIHLSPFVAHWSRLRLSDDDLVALETQLSANPTAGKVMPGAGGMRKVRFAPPSWHSGKSGASRVCYAHFAIREVVFLVRIFEKSEKGNLTKAERNAAEQLMRKLRAALI